MSDDLGAALTAFFTSAVDLPDCPPDVEPGSIWWEERDGWRYPWRVVSQGPATGYPCGEPTKHGG